jgi:hypothetical protein
VLTRVGSKLKFDKPIKEDLAYLTIRPKKTDDPDPGTYQVHEAVTFVKTKNPKFSIGKSKSIKFTEEVQRIKKPIPGVGKYNLEKVLDNISRPYVRTRY